MDMTRPAPAAARPGILVVDDEPLLCALLQSALRRRGFAVWVAGSGPSAVETYSEHQSAISIVLLDVRMPGMDGPKTLAALRAVNPAVVACFMTGYAGEHTAESLLGMGAAGLFDKPFRLDEMIGALWQTAQRAGRDAA